jgi:hypothetical protein
MTWTPTPDATDNILYTYRAAIADKAVGNDGTDLLASMPLWAQHALVFYVAAIYKGEKGDLEGEQQDMQNYEMRVRSAIEINDKQTGHQRHRMTKRRGRDGGSNSVLHVQRVYNLTDGYA